MRITARFGLLLAALASMFLLGCDPAPKKVDAQLNRAVAVYLQAEPFELTPQTRIGWNDYAGGPLGRLSEKEELQQLLDKSVRQAVQAQFESQGYTLTDTPPYDYTLSYAIALDKDLDDKALFERYGMSTGMQGTGKYEKGTLILDLQDVDSQQSLWRGAMQSVVAPKGTMTLEQRQQRLDTVIGVLLKNMMNSRDPG